MAHTASLSQLQSPAYAAVNGRLVPYEDVRIHVGAEALTRALSVFEGLKGYWDEAGEVFRLRSPRRHYDRLVRSASLLHVPVSFSYEEYVEGMAALARALLVPERDLWFRTTLYVTEGHWGEGTAADLVVTAFTQAKHDPDTMRLGVSTWRRAGDVALPTRVKMGANYVGARLARIEARRLGYDDALLLNGEGRVAEATGACVLVAQEGRVVTPPTSESCLDSITVRLVETLARETGTPFERRPLERTEVLTAEECALAGTISELTPVAEVDGFTFRDGGVLAGLRRGFLEAMRGARPLDGLEMVPLARVSELDAVQGRTVRAG